jgi:hypothetical protein
MANRGRQSAASLAIVGSVTLVPRLAPPRELSDPQRAIWLATVNSKPAEWFGEEHVPLLVEYVRHVVTADLLTRQIDAIDPLWMDDDDGLMRFNRLLAMRARESALITTLARNMRLTQQSIYRANKAATLSDQERSKKPWQTLENGS